MSKVISSNFLKSLRSAKRFKKLKDGWVKDALLGVEWGPSSTEKMTWKDAIEYCKKQGGRLPEADELITLVDRSKHHPAINAVAFPDTKTDDVYWTATELSGDPGYAWGVGFLYGLVLDGSKGFDYYVRPVRSSQ